MASFNKVILLGNLTRDPETRTTQSGLVICKLGLAVNRQYRDREGNQQEEVTFVDVDVFGRQAEVIARYMSKGRPILIEGRLKLDQWETPQGERRSRLGVVCENFQFVGSGGQQRGEGAAGPEHGDDYEEVSPPQTRHTAGGADSSSAVDDDDVPF